MAKLFNIESKPLSKAKPCVGLLMRDDGSTEWYENLKAGQILKIQTGGKKAYLNLDFHKTINFNTETDEKKIDEVKGVIETIDNERIAYEKKVEEEVLNVKKKLEDLKQEKNSETEEKKRKKAKEKHEKYLTSLKGKYVKLTDKKLRNFGKVSKPIMGFVLYEKEFNALPNDSVVHDSRQVTEFVDSIVKNFKDFATQRIEGIGKAVLWFILGIGVVAFIVFRFGGDFFTPKVVEKAPEQVAKIPIYFMMSKGLIERWLKRRRLNRLKKE